MQEVAPGTGISIRIRSNHGIIEVQNGEVAGAGRGVLRPIRLVDARVGDAVGVCIDDEAQIIVLQDTGNGRIICFWRANSASAAFRFFRSSAYLLLAQTEMVRRRRAAGSRPKR